MTSNGSDARTPVVSVLIPAYNEGQRISAALESALFQKTRFPVEVIVVDDGSTDDTAAVVATYGEAFSNLKLVKNPANKGKGFSVKTAYNLARGKYVQILDADDYFTSWDKLQKQVDALEQHRDCFAVGHNTLFLHESGVRVVPGYAVNRKFEYKDCSKNKFYCHTSSYLFRRLRSGLPDFFDRETMRGDTPFFLFHAFATKRSVYVMKEVMSVYNVHGNGIWSSMTPEARTDLYARTMQDLQSLVIGDPSSEEHADLQRRIDRVRGDGEKVDSLTKGLVPLNDFIRSCERNAARIYDPDIRAVAFQGMYSLPFADSAAETVGRIAAVAAGITLLNRSYDSRKAAILVSGFVVNGGGVFREIKEIVHALVAAGFQVLILSTRMVETPATVIAEHFGDPRIRYREVKASGFSEQIAELIDILHREAADRIYPFLGHQDVAGVAALQQGLARQIILDFVLDHGLSLGVHSSAIDAIVTKTDSQASALAGIVSADKLALMPVFFTGRFSRNPYQPLRNGRLTTASAAARSYKVETEYKYPYFDLMARAMAELDLQHIHFGPLSEPSLERFESSLKEKGVPRERLIHIPWASDFGGALVERGVDVFIAPFPVCSARVAIEVMSCGIPILNHQMDLPSLPEGGDLCDPRQPLWATPEEFVDVLSEMEAPRLTELSTSAMEHFRKNNASEVALSRFIQGEFFEPQIADYPLFTILDLDLEPFFNSGSTPGNSQSSPSPESAPKPEAVRYAVDSMKQKFWHRTPFRRKMRRIFHEVRGRGG